MTIVRNLLGMMLCFALMPLSARSQEQVNGASENRDQYLLENTDDHGNAWSHDPIVFSRRDLTIIRNYYRTHSTPFGAGEHDGGLLPNQRKQLGRNRTLPVAWEQSLQDLPQQLERSLTPLAPIYRRAVIGKDVLIVDTHTQRITDIIHLAPHRP